MMNHSHEPSAIESFCRTLLDIYLIPVSERFYLFQVKNHSVRHTRFRGYDGIREP